MLPECSPAVARNSTNFDFSFQDFELKETRESWNSGVLECGRASKAACRAHMEKNRKTVDSRLGFRFFQFTKLLALSFSRFLGFPGMPRILAVFRIPGICWNPCKKLKQEITQNPKIGNLKITNQISCFLLFFVLLSY